MTPASRRDTNKLRKTFNKKDNNNKTKTFSVHVNF